MMKVYRSLDEFKPVKNAIVTSGTYDGVHVGHQKILQRLRNIAKDEKGETVVITFWPHPRHVLKPDEEKLFLLNSIEEKQKLLSNQGIEHLLILPFSTEFSSMPAKEYIEKVLVRIGTKKIVIGYNHRFGANREGNFELLKKVGPEYGIEVEEISRQDIDHVGISSTVIRKALLEGKLEVANEYLGQTYSMHGVVVEGAKLGRQLGFPTANIKLGFEYKLLPADGIYAVKVVVESKVYHGMLNIGYRPTIGGTEKYVEVNIFDFNKDIYNTEIEVKFFKRIRTEEKFPSLNELKFQLGIDRSTVTDYFETMQRV